jgi:hypothetical protein
MRTTLTVTSVGTLLLCLLMPARLQAGLTPIQVWAPPNSIEFKAASVCHFPDSDYYGVFAVFRVRSLGGILVDELWYLRVDGLSTWRQYGQIVTSVRLARESVISHVDCTADGDRTAYVVWDRSDDPLDTDGARWARVDLYSGFAQIFNVPSCEGRASFGNGIAFHDGSIAISGGGRGACSACSYVWPDAMDPGTYELVHIWIDGQVPFATDVIWNGENAYLHATLLRFDGTGKPAVVLTQIAPDGSYVDHHVLQEVAWTWSNWNAIYLVLSDHEFNTAGNVLVQTDQRTFWVDRTGVQQGLSRVVGTLANFPSCECWRTKKRIAHTFTWGLGGTSHWEWPLWSGAPLDIYLVDGDPKLSPRACGSSAGFTDPEILLIRKGMTPTYTVESLRLNFEPQE